MIVVQSRIHLGPIAGMKIFDFLINSTDREYQRWWPGTHIEMHTLKYGPNNVGNIVYMDEFVGKYRLKMTAVVIEAEPGRKIVWQLKKLIRLPIWLFLELEEGKEGLTITHTIKGGFEGVGRILDFLFRVFFSREFEKAMDEHAKAEFPKLRDMLSTTNPAR